MMSRLIIPAATEAQEQAALARWLDLHRVRWFHVPNGGHRNIVVGRTLKLHGVKPGVPDNFIVDPPPAQPECCGTVLELKRVSGGRTSREQRRWLRELQELGWATCIANGADDAIKQLQYLGYGNCAPAGRSA